MEETKDLSGSRIVRSLLPIVEELLTLLTENQLQKYKRIFPHDIKTSIDATKRIDVIKSEIARVNAKAELAGRLSSELDDLKALQANTLSVYQIFNETDEAKPELIATFIDAKTAFKAFSNVSPDAGRSVSNFSLYKVRLGHYGYEDALASITIEQ